MDPTVSTAPPDETDRRPTRIERREQLLDAAGCLLAERGHARFTMEGLAEEIGATKAVPYRHFANADDVVVTLYHRELERLAEHLRAAVRGRPAGDPMVRAGVSAYFAYVARRGHVLRVLAGPGSAIPEMAEGKRPVPHVGVEIITAAYDVDGRTAAVLGALVNGLTTEGAESIGLGLATPDEAEALTTAAVLGAIHAVIDEAGHSTA